MYFFNYTITAMLPESSLSSSASLKPPQRECRRPPLLLPQPLSLTQIPLLPLLQSLFSYSLFFSLIPSFFNVINQLSLPIKLWVLLKTVVNSTSSMARHGGTSDCALCITSLFLTRSHTHSHTHTYLFHFGVKFYIQFFKWLIFFHNIRKKHLIIVNLSGMKQSL